MVFGDGLNVSFRNTFFNPDDLELLSMNIGKEPNQKDEWQDS
jgi:hypothetical protein